MNPSEPTATSRPGTKPGRVKLRSRWAELPQPVRLFVAFVIVLLIGFAKPLTDWVRYSFETDLFSYVLLVPFISLYLVWLRRSELLLTSSAPMNRAQSGVSSNNTPGSARASRALFGASPNSPAQTAPVPSDVAYDVLVANTPSSPPSPPVGSSNVPGSACVSLDPDLGTGPIRVDQCSSVVNKKSMNSQPSPAVALVPLAIGTLILLGYWIARFQGWKPVAGDYLAFTMLSFVCILLGGLLLFLGWKLARTVAFPVAFLLLMVPFPAFFTNWIEVFFQHTSANAAWLLFSLSGTTFFREGLVFHLPGIMIEVAEECSGIRSSLVLFIASLLAGYLFLRRPWKRTVLTLAVIPLGILRNGFRIFTIGMLCVHVGPEMIHSPIHHRGGPIFFVLSLIPFFLILFLLRRSERAPAGVPGPESIQREAAGAARLNEPVAGKGKVELQRKP